MGETVLITDAGGRGAALVDAYARSPHVERLIVIPGNDMMKELTDKPVITFPEIRQTNADVITVKCQDHDVDLADICQDNAVAAGVADETRRRGILTIGPSLHAGRLEWDKAWARVFANRHHIPQPYFRVFQSRTQAIDYLNQQADQPRFIKASGLAAGKGALPAHNRSEAINQVRYLKSSPEFRQAARFILVEDWLYNDDGTPGEEFSTFIITDGAGNYQIVGSAQDNKRVFDGDEGPNTGGMGCHTPPLVLTPELMIKIEERIIRPTINGLAEEGIDYRGVLYFGGMVVKRHGQLDPYLVEYNSRWGDPEAQVIIPGITTDFFEIGMAVAQGDISKLRITTDGRTRVVITGASRGYPSDYSAIKGKEITGLDEAQQVEGVRVYGAGVRVENGHYYINGGRLFYIVGERTDIIEAQQVAYEAMSKIRIPGDGGINLLHYRTDIGIRDVHRLANR